jgi:hypothetical protein
MIGPITHPTPNKGLELTAYSLRCAPASSSSSGLAFGSLQTQVMIRCNDNSTERKRHAPTVSADRKFKALFTPPQRRPAVPPARAAPPARYGRPAGAAPSQAERGLDKRLGMG